MKPKAATLILGLALMSQPLALSGQTKPQTKVPKDVVLRTWKVTGNFVGFEAGDYVHALIKPKKGEEISTFINGYGLDYFLAVNANKTGEFTIQTVKTYVQEEGGVIEIDRVISAKFGKTDFATWWKSTRKSMSTAQIEKKYDPLVQKLTKGS